MTKSTFLIAGALILSCSFWSCSESGEKAVKDAENDVFAIHDEVMPKLDETMKLRKRLKAHIASLDSIKAAGSASATLRIDEERDQANRLAKNLAVADSLMFYWMNQYKNDTIAKIPSEDALRYLEQQKDQITDVKTKINSSIQQASQFLAKP